MNLIKSSLLLLLFASSACATVGPGNVGVLWRAFGGTQEHVYGEGKYAVARWNKMYVYDLKTMTQDESLSAITVEGLQLALGTSLRYRLLPNEVLPLHKQVGQAYYDKLVKPRFLSETRRIFAKYSPEQIYLSKRATIEQEVVQAMNGLSGGRYVTIESFLIRDVALPAAIRVAIDQKLVTEQQLLTTRYQMALAKANANLKQIDAASIAAYNNTVRASLSAPLLDYERIQGMSQLARSPNAKTVVVGSSSGSAPVLVESR